ncbi:MAG: type II secretion system protein [Sulfuricella denitrificans]|nr:type II secretion system protein [Sulfuricella denitrificans]
MFTEANIRSQSGISLIEVIIFIVVVSVGVVGLMSVLNSSLKHSADPMLRKQALAVAEALLEEVELMPFTDCDPDNYDPVTLVCSLAEAMGPEAGEARGSLVTPFDNVNDYNGFALAGGGTDIGGNVTVPPGYSATVTVAQDAAFGVAAGFLPAADVLRVAVKVDYNGGNESITLEGYRTRYAPNDMP